VLSSDFYCKENDGTTGAAHLIHTYLEKNETLVVRQPHYSPDIKRYHHYQWHHHHTYGKPWKTSVRTPSDQGCVSSHFLKLGILPPNDVGRIAQH
jgi:hypothetical protein